jgi:hypothetical protein
MVVLRVKRNGLWMGLALRLSRTWQAFNVPCSAGRFIEKCCLYLMGRGKGRFQSFLLTPLGHFLSNERDNRS